MNTQAGAYINSRLVTSSQKRQIMWNIIEPGDPYDIRKSMIARLPGRKNFMGDHLELICLLQAAEIERISQYLDQYKLKFRQNERRDLDRHSYEIQIKQLTQQLAEEGSYRVQNAKLKEFLRKQTIQFEELKKKSGGYEIELARKYEDSLRQIDSLMQQNQIVKSNSNKVRMDYQQALSGKNIQVEELQRRLKDTASRSSEYSQQTEAYYKLEIEFKKLQFQNRRIKEITETKNREIEELQGKSKQLIIQIEEMSSQLRQYSNINHTISEYQNRFSLLGQEIDRLNLVLRQKSGDYNDISNSYKLLEDETRRKTEYIDDLQRKKIQMEQKNMQLEIKMTESIRSLSGLDQSRSLVKTYQSNMQKMSGQVQRLNVVLRKKVQELQESNRRISEYEYQLRKNDTMKRDVQEYRIKYGEFNKKLAQYQNKIAILSQQIERLNASLKRKSDESIGLEQQLRLRDEEIESYHKKFYNIEIEYKTEISRITHINQQYELKITQLSHQNENTYLREELRMCKEQLARVSNDHQSSANFSRESQIKIRKLEDDNTVLNRKISEYQFQMNSLSQEIQRLNSILKVKVDQIGHFQQKNSNAALQMQDARRKIGDLELKINQLNRQIELSKQNYNRNAQFQIQNLKRRINELQDYKGQYQSRLKEYEGQIRVFSQKEQRYSGQVSDSHKKVSDYENRIVVLSQQIERLNEILNKMNSENNDYKRRVSEVEYLKSTISNYEEKFNLAVQQNEGLRKGVSQSSLTQTKMSQEYQQRIRAVNKQNQELDRRCHEYESKLTYANKQIQHSSSVLKSKMEEINSYDSRVRSLADQREALSRKNQELSSANRKIAEYDNKITILSQQIQRLNGILKTKIGEIHNLQEKCRNKQNELANYQRKIKEYQATINRDLQTKIQFLSNQNEELRGKLKQMTIQVNKLPQFESKLTVTYSQVERLNTILRNKSEEAATLEGRCRNSEQENIRYRRRNQQLQATMHRQLKNQSSVFEQRGNQLTEENEVLRRKLRDLSDQNRKVGDYENKVALLSKEIERLNDIMARYTKQIIPSLEEQARGLSFENDDLKRKLTQLSEINLGNQQLLAKFRVASQENEQYHRRIQQYEVRMGQISGEVQRLNSVLRGKLQELNDTDHKLKQVIHENELLKKRLRDSDDTNRQLHQYENQLNILRQQIERLNNVLRGKLEESSSIQGQFRKYKYEYETLQRRYSDLQGSIGEHKSNRTVMEQKLSSFNQENQELRKTIRELSDSNRRISEYQSKIALLSQEIERLNGNLRNKQEELNSSENMFRNYKRQSEGKISNLNNDLEEYRRKTSDNVKVQSGKMAQYQNKMLILSQEIERLNYVLKEHTYQLEVFNKKQSQYLTEIERLNNTLRLKVEETSRWQQNNNQLKSRLRSYEENMSSAGQEYQKLKGVHNHLNEEYIKANKNLVEYEQSINKLYNQFERIQSMLQENKKENYQLKVQLQESGNLIEKNRALSAQIDRLNQIVQTQRADLEDLRLCLADQSSLQKRVNQDMAMMVVLFAQIESLRKRVKDTQIQIETVRRSSLAPFKV